jgi:dTDP-4-dehydrorhamnose reductase
MAMRIVLLGANGQLGTDLCRQVAQGSFDIDLIALTRQDVDASEAIIIDHQFDVLINCVAYNRVDDAESNKTLAMRINGESVGEMASICAKQNARLLHVSTDYVFEGERDRPYLEHDSINPLSVYGQSKALGEKLAGEGCPDTLIFRTASLFGIAGAGNFVETMIRVGRERGELRVVDDQIMSPTGTADVAKMILTALINQAPAGIYHAVNSGQASWHEFAKRIIEQSNISATVEPIPASQYPVAAKRPANSVLDNTKLSNIVGPIPHWTDALDRYLRDKGHLV